MSDRSYDYKSSGTNSQVNTAQTHRLFPRSGNQAADDPVQGNHYCARDYGSSASNSNSYHYSNK